MASYKVLLLLLALLFLAKAHESCSHDEEERTDAEEHDVDEDLSAMGEGRLLQSSSMVGMKIVASYDLLNSAPSSFKSYIQNDLAPPVFAWYEGALKVKYPLTSNLKVTTSSICGYSTPSIFKNGVSAQFGFVFNHKNEDTTTVASSKACSRASGTKRPLVGYTSFNRQQFSIPASGDVLHAEKNMYLLIHEMMHSLAMSSSNYDSYIDSNGNTRRGHVKSVTLNGRTRTVLDVPPLTEKLRNFYGCSTVPGLYLENDGGSGTASSHFEKRFFPYDSMSSGAIYGRRVSEFQLAVFEGSGWFVPNYAFAEPYNFGKGQGCSFISATTSTMTNFDEYCSGSTRMCSNAGRSGGKCTSDEKTEGFKFVKPDLDYDCENSEARDNARLSSAESYGRDVGSRCFSGTLSSSSSTASSTSFCFKYNCVGSGSTTQLEVSVGSSKAICKSEGKISVSGYKGTINCPDPLFFCETQGKKYCQRNCMNQGTCVDNKCVCNAGFKGIDCAIKA